MKVLFCKQAQVNESGEKLKNNITNSECADGLSKGDFVKGLQNNSNDSYQFRLIWFDFNFNCVVFYDTNHSPVKQPVNPK